MCNTTDPQPMPPMMKAEPLFEWYDGEVIRGGLKARVDGKPETVYEGRQHDRICLMQDRYDPFKLYWVEESRLTLYLGDKAR